MNEKDFYEIFSLSVAITLMILLSE